MNIRIQVNDLISPSLRALQQLNDPAVKQQLAHAAANVLVKQSKEAFARYGSDFAPWAPRKDKTQTHRLMEKTKALRKSLRVMADANGAAVVSDRQYASYHQHGTKKMVARPFVPVDPEGNLSARADEMIRSAVAGKLRQLVPGLPPPA